MSDHMQQDPPRLQLDLTGIPCPMNYVRIKLHMETMKTGHTLYVVLDCGEPYLNVSRSLKINGDQILEEVDLGKQVGMLIQKG